MKKGYWVALIIFMVLLLDQGLKYYIKTNFYYNEDHTMLGANWARLHFVENEGMAFGITFDWVWGKLVLSLFRVLMVAGLFWYIRLLMRHQAPMGFIICIALITAGAIGNIIDSALYALIFSASAYHSDIPAQLTAFGQGYGMTDELPLNGFLHGKVVDMLYFPIKWINVPEWVPFLGGEEYLFFSPIFNIADAAITVGVISIILFQRKFFREGFAADEVAQKPISQLWDEAEQQIQSDEQKNTDDREVDPEPETTKETSGQTETLTDKPASAEKNFNKPAL